MKIEHSVTNKNFVVALKIVQKDFPHLFHESLLLIKLCKTSEHVWSNNLGIHKRLLAIKNDNYEGYEMIHYVSYSHIFICNGRHSITQFINTLVHELTHLQQHIRIEVGESLTKEQMEAEAYLAGRKAAEKYEGIWPFNY